MDDVIATLGNPDFYSDSDEDVTFIETHASAVFRAGNDVYKLKKPVDFGFLNYGTVLRRRLMCHLEVQINQLLAPDVYFGVLELVLRNGEFQLGGKGKVVDYLVHMRRLPDSATLAWKLPHENIELDEIDRISRRIASFHRRADRTPEIDRWGLPAAIGANVEENFQQVEPYIGRAIPNAVFDSIATFSRTFLTDHRGLLHQRVRDGMTRDGHGDIRAEHVYLMDEVKIIDRIEFNDRIRYGDVATDVGFLAMDLDASNRPDLSDRLIDSYVDRSDLEVAPVLDFYRCYRAYVRGKVTAFRLEQAAPDQQAEIRLESRRFFHLSWRYAANNRGPRLLVMSGLTGTGKSTLGSRLGSVLPAKLIDSDTTRKQLAGLDPDSRQHVPVGSGIYNAEMTSRVYEELLDQAHPLLAAGRTVILDATYTSAGQRDAAAQLARETGTEFLIVVCQAPEETVRQRLAQRGQDSTQVSDGRWEIYVSQRNAADPLSSAEEATAVRVDTSTPMMSQIETVLVRLEDQATGNSSH